MATQLNIHQPHLLVVEDDPDLREALVDTLQLENYRISEADCAEMAVDSLSRRHDIDLIISDVNMGKMSGHDLLRHVKTHFPQIPVLLITAYASINESVQAMKEGAVDYLVKPFEPKLLVDTVAKFAGGKVLKKDEPIAKAPSSRQLLVLAKRVAQSDSTALLIGESGTGKEVLARYVHDNSPRADKPFIAINCAAIPENMLEAMLFGYEKGAYTGAHTSTPGKFEQANGGTLLLDEISEMDIGLQAKLLRVLQEREVERLGGRKSIQLDVRVIATSNRDMRREVAEGKFREDLYFRLSVLPLQWAPLRDRREDILPIAENLLRRHAIKQHRTQVYLSESAQSALLDYAWPGNVRELDNVMQRALILQPGTCIHAHDLGLMMADTFSKKPSLLDVSVADGDQLSSQEHSVGFLTQQDSASTADISYRDSCFTEVTPENLTEDNSPARLGSDMRRHEFEIILKTLKQEGGSKKNTADRLGISPRTLRYKMARLREEGFDLDKVALA